MLSHKNGKSRGFRFSLSLCRYRAGMETHMKKIKNFVIGGIQQKVFNLVLIVILLMMAAYTAVIIYQVGHINNLVNDTNHEVILFIDSCLLKAEKVSFHPNDNRVSLVISSQDMLKFIKNIGNSYEVLDLYN